MSGSRGSSIIKIPRPMAILKWDVKSCEPVSIFLEKNIYLVVKFFLTSINRYDTQ